MTIRLRAIKYPKEQIIELDELTHTGLMDLKYQAKRLIEEINDWLKEIKE